MPSSDPSTASSRDGIEEEFEVTHPFHPLYGERFRLVSRWKNWGGDRVLFEDGEGRGRSVPTAWTSVAPRDPFAAISEGRSLFRTEDLLALVAVVDRLLVPEGKCKEDFADIVKINTSTMLDDMEI